MPRKWPSFSACRRSLAATRTGQPQEPEFVLRLDQIGDPDDPGAPAGAGVSKTLANYAGNVGCAAEKLGVTRAELMEYLTRRPDVQTAVGDVREELVDHAESALRVAISDKKPWAIRFALKTLGRLCGYSENPKDEPEGAKLLPGQPNWGLLSEEDLVLLERLCEIVLVVPRIVPSCAFRVPS